MKTLVIIPTYNEAENIERIVLKVLELSKKESLNLNVLVVDDSSPDGTAQIVRNIGLKFPEVRLVIRKKKEGLRQAYMEGFKYAISNNYEAVIMMDADGSHNPEFIKDLVSKGEFFDLVIGSRYTAGGYVKDWTLFRKFVSKVGNLYAQTLLGLKVNELTGGFNFIKTEFLKKINLDGIKNSGYAFQIELKYKLIKAGAKAFEVPIGFQDRKLGKSKFNIPIILEGILQTPFIRFRK